MSKMQTYRKAGVVACLAALLGGCASQDWTRADTYREVTWQIVNAADGYTTAQIRKSSSVIERQPVTRAILGDEPETGETVLYFTSLGVSHWLVSRMLPSKWRRWWQGGTLVYSGAMVINNCEVGLCD